MKDRSTPSRCLAVACVRLEDLAGRPRKHRAAAPRLIRVLCVTALVVLAALSVAPRKQAFGQTPFLTERAYQDREILYELLAPESHAFRITHDYTVRRPGEQYYFNVVRAGSHVSYPESIDLDTADRFHSDATSATQSP